MIEYVLKEKDTVFFQDTKEETFTIEGNSALQIVKLYYGICEKYIKNYKLWYDEKLTSIYNNDFTKDSILNDKEALLVANKKKIDDLMDLINSYMKKTLIEDEIFKHLKKTNDVPAWMSKNYTTFKVTIGFSFLVVGVIVGAIVLLISGALLVDLIKSMQVVDSELDYAEKTFQLIKLNQTDKIPLLKKPVTKEQLGETYVPLVTESGQFIKSIGKSVETVSSSFGSMVFIAPIALGIYLYFKKGK